MNATALPSASAAPSGVLPLSDWGLIRASGADAGSFLHGQLTQDVQSLAVGQARLAGYCSAKGRLLATFVVWRSSPEDFLLACSADVLPTVLKRLSMFVLRARCRLSDAGADTRLWGAVGPAGAQALGEAATGDAARVGVAPGVEAVRLPDVDGVPRWLAAVAADRGLDGPALSADTWAWLEVRSGVARVVAATAEAFVPQMVNLELTGGVSFKKGCYPGQEVVARSQYRGTLKRRGALLAGPEAMQPGQAVVHSEDPGQPAGTVALTALGPDGRHWSLVEVKLAALASGTLHALDAEGPVLAPESLPYEIPVNEQ